MRNTHKWFCGVSLLLLSAQGCPSTAEPNLKPVISSYAGKSDLVQGQAGSIFIRVQAFDPDGSVVAVTAELSAIGGPIVQPLQLGEQGWSWSGPLTPPTAGATNLTFTATDDEGESSTATYAQTVLSSENRTVCDLGDGVGILLRRIPAGSFAMGTASTDVISYYPLGGSGPIDSADWSSAARPVHTVTLADVFYMGEFEVTQGQWKAVMGDTPLASWDDGAPVNGVSWNQAVAFCDALSSRTGETFRLPSEAEWEYACKAGSGDTPWSFGDDAADVDSYAWTIDNAASTIRLAGLKPANAFGLCDMHGNVWEWCADLWHPTYQNAPADGSTWTVGGDTAGRVLRGGSVTNTPDAARSAYRNRFGPDDHYGDFGFRVVRVESELRP